MLVIISTHPIQYQVPLWKALARDSSVPFEVWYLTHHAVTSSHDAEFGRAFAWDIELLSGYPNRLLNVVSGADPTNFLQCRLNESLVPQLKRSGARAVWVQGWQVLAYWQAAWAAKRAGREVWLRGESNDLAPVPYFRRHTKGIALGQLFQRVDRFLCIGSANRRLYRSYGVPEERLYEAPYAIDNDRFATQADMDRHRRSELRRKWGIAEDAFCVLFCGKFIEKKRPYDLVVSARAAAPRTTALHLLFAGSGQLGGELRAACRVAFDAEGHNSVADGRIKAVDDRPLASFAGFLNQTEITQAYVAADCLVLPSDFGETWGLVANEAMASGLPCIISDHCGCAEDLGAIAPNQIFPFANTDRLSYLIARMACERPRIASSHSVLAEFSFAKTVQSVTSIYGDIHRS